jgi:predicted DNA-binding helix-hairpin-helix protein
MGWQRKLEILADAAKYDASCASSGTEKRDSSDGKGLGSTAPGMGICHSYAPDGRCISLLKVLLTNACNYDCLYCVNRTSSNVPRTRFTVDEVVKLTIDFYRRNYIEGLFLSSGIIRSADYTMEQVVSVARKLREEYHFRGYICWSGSSRRRRSWDLDSKPTASLPATNAKRLRKGARATKQSMPQQAEKWIASLRSQ